MYNGCKQILGQNGGKKTLAVKSV